MKNEKLEKQASSEIAQSRERFEKWCPITIVDVDKAPRAAVLKIAYWTAWQAAERDTRERCAQLIEGLDIDEVVRQPGTLAEFWQALAERIRGKE